MKTVQSLCPWRTVVVHYTATTNNGYNYDLHRLVVAIKLYFCSGFDYLMRKG